MRSVQLVIDIGSKYTTISQENKGFVLKDASLVFVTSKGNKIELIESGRNVASYIGQTRQNEQVIYPIKEGIVNHERAAVLMYKSFLNKVVNTGSLIRPRIRAIACVSCGLSNVEKHDIEKVLTDESTDHEWNAVKIGEKWCLIDTTWGAGSIVNDASVDVDRLGFVEF